MHPIAQVSQETSDILRQIQSSSEKLQHRVLLFCLELFLLVQFIKKQMNISELASKAFTSSSPILNYKELYEETKKNVTLFISQVDNQLSKILTKHERQISALKRQNEALKQQLKGQTQSQISSNQNSTLKQRRNVSTAKSYSHEKIKDFIDCELSDISLAQSKTIFTQKKRNSIISYILQDKDENIDKTKKTNDSKVSQRSNSIGNFDKQNLFTEQNSQLVQLKSRLNVCKRAKKTNICFLNDHESVKDVLKNLRVKANTPVSFQDIMKRQAEEKPKNIIEPSMFASYKK